MTDQWQVELFLNKFHSYWPPNYFVVPREKNNEALADLRLTPKQRREEILSLTASNYVDGPVPDQDRPGDDVWIFGALVEKVEVYIKLKTFETKGGKRVGTCLSFHRADRLLKFPLK